MSRKYKIMQIVQKLEQDLVGVSLKVSVSTRPASIACCPPGKTPEYILRPRQQTKIHSGWLGYSRTATDCHEPTYGRPTDAWTWNIVECFCRSATTPPTARDHSGTFFDQHRNICHRTVHRRTDGTYLYAHLRNCEFGLFVSGSSRGQTLTIFF